MPPVPRYNAIGKYGYGVFLMSIENLRDLIIVIWGIVGIIAVSAIVVLAFMFYSKVKPILNSVKKTTDTVARITASVEEAVIKPIAQIMSFMQGIRSALNMVKKFTGKGEE